MSQISLAEADGTIGARLARTAMARRDPIRASIFKDASLSGLSLAGGEGRERHACLILPERTGNLTDASSHFVVIRNYCARGLLAAEPMWAQEVCAYFAAPVTNSSIRIGNPRTRTPVACQTALATAPAEAVMPISPTPLMPSAFT